MWSRPLAYKDEERQFDKKYVFGVFSGFLFFPSPFPFLPSSLPIPLHSFPVISHPFPSSTPFPSPIIFGSSSVLVQASAVELVIMVYWPGSHAVLFQLWQLYRSQVVAENAATYTWPRNRRCGKWHLVWSLDNISLMTNTLSRYNDCRISKENCSTGVAPTFRLMAICTLHDLPLLSIWSGFESLTTGDSAA